VKPHPHVTHCAGRVQNYFGFLLAQTRTVPRGRGKDDTSENNARECPKFLFLYFFFSLILLYSRPINNVIIIFAHNNIVDITWLIYYIIEYVHTLIVSYLLLHIYTLRFNTGSVIVYDVNFFRTHCEIIIEFSFKSIILLPTAILYILSAYGVYHIIVLSQSYLYIILFQNISYILYVRK